MLVETTQCCKAITLQVKINTFAKMIKNSPAKVGDVCSIPGLGRAPGGGNGNPLQYSCLANSMARGPRWAIVHGLTESARTDHTEVKNTML